MDKKTLTLLPILALFFSPLVRASTDSFYLSRTTWFGLMLFLICFAAFFSLYQFRVHRRFSIISLAMLGIISLSFFLGVGSANPFALIMYCMGILLFLFASAVSRDMKLRAIFPFLLIGFAGLYAQWGIAQFIVQQDLGLSRFGESVLVQTTAGVATFSIGQEKYVRAYGPFAHANALGGALLIGTILLFMQKKHAAAAPFFTSLWFLLGFGILVSFSRTAIAGLAILLAISLAKANSKRILLPICISLLAFLPILLARSFDPNSVAAEDRLTGVSWFFDTAIAPQVLVRGLGVGNYSLALAEYLMTNNIPHDPWDIAPVHSVPLLLLSELGLLLSVAAITLAIFMFRKSNAWIFLVLVPALILDHYFATQLGPFALLMTTAGIVVQ